MKIKTSPKLIRELNEVRFNLIALNSTTIKKELDEAIIGIQISTNALSELGEIDSLRLQMAMDKVSRFEEVISNILKKINDTSNDILKNLK